MKMFTKSEIESRMRGTAPFWMAITPVVVVDDGDAGVASEASSLPLFISLAPPSRRIEKLGCLTCH